MCVVADPLRSLRREYFQKGEGQGGLLIDQSI